MSAWFPSELQLAAEVRVSGWWWFVLVAVGALAVRFVPAWALRRLDERRARRRAARRGGMLL